MSNPVDLRKLHALSHEVDAVSALFRHGFAILSEYRFASRDAEPVFVCLAGGCEKLLKLTIGLHELELGRPWPPQGVMRNQWGHKIKKLDERVREIINVRASNSTASGYVRGLLGEVAGDDIVTQVIATVSRYAEQGRFYNLDALGDAAQLQPSPAQLWNKLHEKLLEERCDSLAPLAVNADQAWEDGRRELNGAIVDSMRRWCKLIASAWMTGVIGSQAKTYASQLELLK
ncbi:hypothetical protein AB0M35_28610 [Micromonospora sp. NPDC051196]|uniref:hypothetical protein n=1 Tax=Micromonospora sp. NPDC051196 TaxID=3155281 RepID=UPI003429A36D